MMVDTQQAMMPAHELVARRLREKIVRGESAWRPGTRLPPIKKLARQLGTGQTNTHRAVKTLAAEGLLVARPRKGTFVRSSDPTVSGGKSSPLRGKTVAMFYQGARIDPFLSQAVDRVSAYLNDAGALLHFDPHNGLSLTPAMQRHMDADAFVVINPNWNPPIQMREGQLLVAIDTGVDTNVAMSGGYDVILVDNWHGGHEAGAWLRRIGVSDVCFMGVPQLWRDGRLLDAAEQLVRPVNYEPISARRLSGFETGWGSPVPEYHRLMARQHTGRAGARAFEHYLSLPDRPAGVFCASDDLAVGFIYAGFAHGMDPGRDYQIIGFDGQFRGRNIDGGPLTTIDVPSERMGQLAAEMLEQRFANPGQPVRRVCLGGTLFTGNTARALAPGTQERRES